MRQPINITLFNKGIISSVAPQDIDINACVYSENLDANIDGKLQGIKISSNYSTYGKSYKKGGFLKRDTGEYDLIYTDGTDLIAMKDFYGTPSESTVVSSVEGKVFIKEGRHFLIGTGNDADHPSKWVGYTDHKPMGGIGTLSFTGSGLNDIGIAGNYTGAADGTYTIKINATGANDQIVWKKDAGSYGLGVEISAADTRITIQEGLYFVFAAVTGHTVDDYWVVNVYANTDSTLRYYDAYLDTNEGTGASTGEIVMAGGGSSSTYLHRYKYSLVYNGVNESALSTDYIDNENASNTNFDDGIIIWMKNGASDLTSLDYRITALNLYVAISTDTSSDNLGEYQLLNSISFIDARGGTVDEAVSDVGLLWQPSSGATPAYDGNDVILDIASNPNLPGKTYEANSGIPEVNDAVVLNYNLAALQSGYLFVCDAYENSLDESDLYLFRSKQGSYNTFDIIEDKLWLGFTPTAIIGFNGKVYIWDNSHTFVVDPQNLFVEDITPGIGCLSDLSLSIIDLEQYHALVWADSNNIYLTSGQGINPIGDAIKLKIDSNSIDWQTSVVHDNTVIIFDAVKQLIMVYDSLVANTDCQVFAYHLTKKRWDYFKTFLSTYHRGAFTGINGETYSSDGTDLVENFGGTTNRAWVYISPELTYNSQKKKYYYYYYDYSGTGTITPTYSVTSGSSWRAIASNEIKDASDDWEYQYSIRLKLSGAAGTNTVDIITLIYREMTGLR